MGYLDTPRLHFSGQFYADPSTVNNDPTHYDPAVTRPSPWQEPKGNHYFQLRDCRVRSVLDQDGNNAPNDPVVGAKVESTDTPSPAKIVDLDVYQQGVPTIYGLQIKLTLADGSALLGTLDPITLNGLWFNAVLPDRGWNEDYGGGSHGGDGNAAGLYQGVIRFNLADWPITKSTVLNTLRSRSQVINNQIVLACRFVVDNYHNVADSAQYRLGRITGAIGPFFPGDAPAAVGPRYLQAAPMPSDAPWYVPSFYGAPFKVDTSRKKLVIDLANSLCRQSPGGPPVDLGTLTAQIKVPGVTFVEIGPLNYSAFIYDNNSGISEIALNDELIKLLASNPLHLRSSRDDIGYPLVLSEDPSGRYFSIDTRLLRMEGDPGTTATSNVYVTQWGQPAANVQLGLVIEPVYGKTPGATVPPSNPGDTHQALGVFIQPTSYITPTDGNGVAQIVLRVEKNPGQRTPQLDGQLYFAVVYDLAEGVPPLDKQAPVQEQCLSVVAFSQYAVNSNPSWEIVQQMMIPYVKIYPGMTERIDLSDHHTFHIFALNPPWIAFNPSNPPPPEPYLGLQAGAITYYLTRDFNDPRYMPITRDLSLNRLRTILHYIQIIQKAGGS
jgi:hypothetical protein